MTTPLRARLPMPLPTNFLRAPSGTLDVLTVTFRVREDSVTVASPETACSATYWCALGEGCLSYDGDVEGHPGEVPVTAAEERALATLDGLANEWDAAVKANDRRAVNALAERIRTMEPPKGLALKVAA